MVVLFSVTLLISASLLFVVQPMVGKMLLPKLGGTPAVWNTCMVFFQAILLAGYAYAHGSIRWFGVKTQAVVHLLVMLTPLIVLPIALANIDGPRPGDEPVSWLMLSLLVHVGPAFFVVSSSAPLLQRWFAATDHKDAHDPYFLYAASNIGSLVALLGYPFLIERVSMLDQQASAWSIGYVTLVAMFAICVGSLLMKTRRQGLVDSAMRADGSHNPSPTITWGQRGWWMVFAFVPSSLMLGVTTHITTDVAAVPLLWVVPLALYLLTFIIVFSKRPLVTTATMSRVMPIIVLPLALLMFEELNMPWLLIMVHLAAFFVCSMVCHAQLADARPAAANLTEFFLWMSVGGVLGGVFNAIVAPLVFDTVIEYPLVLVVACLVRRTPKSTDVSKRNDVIFAMGLALVLAVIVGVLDLSNATLSRGVFVILFGVPAIVCVASRKRPVRFGLCFASLMTAIGLYVGGNAGDKLHVERNFFGVKHVLVDTAGRFRMLVHAGTDHGRQRVEPDRATEPLSYYHRTGPIGDVFKVLNGRRDESPIAVIGLGVGSIASYAQPGQSLTFFELDPAIERLAYSSGYFSFLAESEGKIEIVTGDGRLTMTEEPDGKFGLIVLDAFSGDAVPTHLISVEAIRMYLDKLRDDGMVVFHISNRFFNLEPVLARAAGELDIFCLRRLDAEVTEELLADGKMMSHYVVLARDEADLKAFADSHQWQVVKSSTRGPLWTDQYCDILSVLR